MKEHDTSHISIKATIPLPFVWRRIRPSMVALLVARVTVVTRFAPNARSARRRALLPRPAAASQHR